MSDVSRTEPCRVLVVEDDADIRDMMHDVFDAEGMAVTAVASADEAVALVATDPPNVVLTDISLGLPDRDGVWLFRELRRHAPSLPVIAITGHSERLKELSIVGFNAVLSKPVALDDLVPLVRTVASTTR